MAFSLFNRHKKADYSKITNSLDSSSLNNAEIESLPKEEKFGKKTFMEELERDISTHTTGIELFNHINTNNQRIYFDIHDMNYLSKMMTKGIVLYVPIKSHSFKDKDEYEKSFTRSVELQKKQRSKNISCLKEQLKFLEDKYPIFELLMKIYPGFGKNIHDKVDTNSEEFKNYEEQRKHLRKLFTTPSERFSDEKDLATILQETESKYTSLFNSQEYKNACKFEDDFIISEIALAIRIYVEKLTPEEKERLTLEMQKYSKIKDSIPHILESYKQERISRKSEYDFTDDKDDIIQ